jgi:AcrR family transcriptional regulator
VGRQTVYRWWPTKADVLVEALRELAHLKAAKPDPDTGDALDDVRTILTTTFRMTTGFTGQALVGLMAEAQADDALATRLQTTVIGPRREALKAVLRRGVSQGRLTPAVPLELVVDMVYGTRWYRLLHRHAAVDDALADDLVAAVTKLLEAD